MSIAETIEQAKKAYRHAALDCGDALLPPADEETIDAITAQLSLPIPLELRAIYHLHGGQEYVSPGNSGLFGMHRLLTPAELVEHYLMTSGNCEDNDLPTLTDPPEDGSPPYWDNHLLPFARWNDRNLCIHAELGDVWDFGPYEGLGRHWPTIEAVLREAMAGVRAVCAEKPSWRGRLPATVTDVREWTEVDLFLPTCCWSMLKARITPPEFREFVTQLGLTPQVDRKYPPTHNRDWLWAANASFKGDWWDPSPSLNTTFISASDQPAYLAKHENGILYFKVSQSLTESA